MEGRPEAGTGQAPDGAGAAGPAGPGGPLAEFGYTQELKRSLGLRDLVVYGLVFMVPIAPFAIFGVVFNTSKGMVPLTYIIGLVAMIFTALSYREMSRAFPIAGSVYAYAGRGISPATGFLAGWAILLDYLLIPTLLYVTGAAALAAVLPAVPQVVWVLFFIVVNTVVNLMGIQTAAVVNRLMLAAEALVLVVFIVLAVAGIARGVNGAHWSTTPFYNPHVFRVGMVFAALSVAALSFLGFDAISTLAEEVKGGPRIVGRATVLSLVLVAVLFVIQTYLAALLLPGKTAFTGNTAMNDAFYTVAGLVGGGAFKDVVAVMVALSSALANSLVAQAATSRLLFSMSRDRQLPRFLSHVHPKRKVPERAVLLVGAITVVLGVFFVGQIGLLSSLVNFGALFSFLVLHITVVVHYLIRRRERSFGLHLAVPVAGFAIIAYVLYNADTHTKIGGLIWLAIGCVVVAVRKLTGRPMTLAQPK
jgi:amino acid transporter